MIIVTLHYVIGVYYSFYSIFSPFYSSLEQIPQANIKNVILVIVKPTTTVNRSLM